LVMSTELENLVARQAEWLKWKAVTGAVEMGIKLEELKATAAKLQQQIEQLEKPKQWEPRYGDFYHTISTLPRQTKEAAAEARDTMRTHDRLLAYVYEYGGGWVADWTDRNPTKYSVYFSSYSDNWEVGRDRGTMQLGGVYMSQACAKGLVAKLESGEVVL
jgi:hypothetical protein